MFRRKKHIKCEILDCLYFFKQKLIFHIKTLFLKFFEYNSMFEFGVEIFNYNICFHIKTKAFLLLYSF